MELRNTFSNCPDMLKAVRLYRIRHKVLLLHSAISTKSFAEMPLHCFVFLFFLAAVSLHDVALFSYLWIPFCSKLLHPLGRREMFSDSCDKRVCVVVSSCTVVKNLLKKGREIDFF